MNKQCENPGAYRFTWPGCHEARICAACVGWLQAVAEALTLPLQIIPLRAEEQGRCEQRITPRAAAP